MKDTKKNIAIVCGGDSSEHDVSLRSAQGLYSFFDKERYNVYVVDVKGLDWHVDLSDGTTAKINRNDFSFSMGGKTVFFDYAYITIHGTPGENGVLQGYFDLIKLPYSTSGVLVEAMTFNKFVLNQYLRGYGVLVADSLLIRSGYEELVSDDEVERRIGMPCFVKPAADGEEQGPARPGHTQGHAGKPRGDGGGLRQRHGDLGGMLQDQEPLGGAAGHRGGHKERVLRLRRQVQRTGD